MSKPDHSPDNAGQHSPTAAKPSKKGAGVWIGILFCAIIIAAYWLLMHRGAEQNAAAPETGQMRVQLPAPPPGAREDTSAARQHNSANATDSNATAQTASAVTAGTPALPADTPSSDTASAATANIGRVMPPVREDSVVTPAFVDDLAAYIVAAYYPASAPPAPAEHGVLTLSPKSANKRYGADMTGLTWSGDDLHKGRQSVLRYVLTPTMVDALYRLYADSFMDALQRHARKAVRTVEGYERPLTRMEIKEMHQLLAYKVQATAGVLRACAVMEDAMPRVDAMLASARAALSANQTFQEALHAYQQLDDGKHNTATLTAARKRMDDAGKTYQQSIMQRERTKESLANALRKYAGVGQQDDAANLYVAQWVYRRVQDDPRVFPAIMAIHDNLADLSERLEKRAAL